MQWSLNQWLCGQYYLSRSRLRVAPTKAVRHDLSRGLPTRKFKLSGYLCFWAFLKWIFCACNYVSIYWCWINFVRGRVRGIHWKEECLNAAANADLMSTIGIRLCILCIRTLVPSCVIPLRSHSDHSVLYHKFQCECRRNTQSWYCLYHAIFG